MGTYQVELFKDAAGAWRWRFMEANKQIMGDSGEGYRRRGSAKKAYQKIAAAIVAGNVRIVDASV